MNRNGVTIDETFAEAFPMKATRILITAHTLEWARNAAVAATGFATSVIACGCEAGIERELGPDETPDGRPGIAVLLFAWAIVIIAFFILSIQLFITLIEFKLVTLAGFVLLPFAFFNRTAFMAERVLGHIVSTGIKVLVLAVITGIGTTLFSQFTSAGLGVEPDINQVMAIALAALSLPGSSSLAVELGVAISRTVLRAPFAGKVEFAIGGTVELCPHFY